MQKYINQLVGDIISSTANVNWPFAEKELHFNDWIPDEEEDKTAPIRNLEDWTGIRQEMLPPESMMNDEQVHAVLEVLKKMLDTYNCSFVLQTQVPERIQYAAIRDNFNQEVKVKRWHMGFFELCVPGTEHGNCVLGEHCQCAFYAGFFSGSDDIELTPEEERARELDIEIRHLQNRYGEDWLKYYPYHLDPNYDDEDGNPYDYGMDDYYDDDEEDEDNWWRS